MFPIFLDSRPQKIFLKKFIFFRKWGCRTFEFFQLLITTTQMEGQKTMKRSPAAMQFRNETKDSLDDYPTPPWATRALCEWLGKPTLKNLTCREPAANRGFMVRPLSEFFGTVKASDVHDYGFGFGVSDFLNTRTTKTDWTITNPPFNRAEAFIEKALESSTRGVAMIVRNAFVESVGRYERLFSQRPPTDILQFSERVPMTKGTYDAKVSSAIAYSWLVWRLDTPAEHTRFHWIAPCRKRLERPSDLILPAPANANAEVRR